MNIYEIAKKCNVSVATISRVINGKDGVSDKKRAEIEAEIAKMGFTPKISKYINDTIAVFFSLQKSRTLSNYFIMSVIDGISDVVFANGYNFTLIPIDKINKEKGSFATFCKQHQIGGAIFLSLRPSDTYIFELSKIVPLVVVGNSFDNEDIACIDADNYNGAYELICHLIEQGHKRIMYAVADMSFSDHLSRFLGYKRAIDMNEIPFDTNMLLHYSYTDDNEEFISAAIDRLFASEETRPTAIFCCNDQEAYKFANIMKSKGISIPEDISLVGFDDYELSAYFIPELTTVKQNLFDEGEMAARLICEAMKTGNPVPTKKIVVPTELVVRKSVKKL